ncbi:hypothetical protein EBS43_02760 [bacterium]|jgi:hypothetical protein|nr:hypothetical protein [bacterium]
MRVQNKMKQILLFILLNLSLCQCSELGLNTSSTARQLDPRPSGIPVASGVLTPLNGQSNITGNALIFLQSPGSYILRLEGLSMTWEAGLKIKISSTLNGITQSPTLLDLRFNSGDQNYNFTTPGTSAKFDFVYIYSTQRILDYASARLIAN